MPKSCHLFWCLLTKFEIKEFDSFSLTLWGKGGCLVNTSFGQKTVFKQVFAISIKICHICTPKIKMSCLKFVN